MHVASGIALSALALAGWACGGSSASSDIGQTLRTASCPGAEVSLPKNRIVVLGNVAFAPRAGWKPGDGVQVGHYPHNTLFAKVALWVRGPDQIVLRVDPPARIKGWSPPGKKSRITVAPCAEEGWRVFAGGFIVPRPGRCVTLRIEIIDGKAEVPFGVGVKC